MRSSESSRVSSDAIFARADFVSDVYCAVKGTGLSNLQERRAGDRVLPVRSALSVVVGGKRELGGRRDGGPCGAGDVALLGGRGAQPSMEGEPRAAQDVELASACVLQRVRRRRDDAKRRRRWSTAVPEASV